MVHYPLDFISQAEASAGISGSWVIRSGAYSSACAIPIEFGGEGGGYSPEDLFAQALTNCLLATFKVYAQGSKLAFQKIEIRTVLTVDKNQNGQPVMSRCHFDVFIYGVERPDRAELILAKAFQSGFILNSVSTQLEYVIHLREMKVENDLHIKPLKP